MADRNPIDVHRNSSGTMKIKSPDDDSPIRCFCEIDGALHVIKDRGIYRIQLADKIDPQRTNIDIPDTFQRVLAYGTDCDIVQKTLMTAKRLFDPNVLGPSFNKNRAIDRSFEALKNIIFMHEMQLDLEANLQKIEASLSGTSQDRSLRIPSVDDVQGLVKTFIQKADHATIELFETVKLFYPEGIGKSWFESLLKFVREKHGEDSSFTKFLVEVLPFLKFIRNARNCIEHPNPDRKVIVRDITLLPSGQLSPPSIEVIHPESPQSPMHITDFMENVIELFVNVSESMLACLCAHNVPPFSGFPVQVIEFTPEQQKFGVRYGYGMHINGAIIPIG